MLGGAGVENAPDDAPKRLGCPPPCCGAANPDPPALGAAREGGATGFGAFAVGGVGRAGPAIPGCANPAGGAARQAMGRTRGGRNTKIMALTNGQGLPVKLLLIEGQAYEGNHVIPLLEAPAGLKVVGDKGFDSDKLRRELEELGASHCFPSKSNRKHKRRLNRKLYRQRYKVENYFCRLKRWASASTRRDKLAAHFLALIQFAAVIDWLRYGC